MVAENRKITGYEIHDVVKGIVTGGCASGLFLKLENGESAFARFGALNTGTEVLCSILKKANERFYILASIDSVIREEDERAA